MSTPIFPRYNDDEVVELVSVLEKVIRFPKNAGLYRREIYDVCDKLIRLVVTVEPLVGNEEEESMYLCYFDALGYLTDCVHGPGVKLRLVHQAIRRLEDLKRIANSVPYATA